MAESNHVRDDTTYDFLTQTPQESALGANENRYCLNYHASTLNNQTSSCEEKRNAQTIGRTLDLRPTSSTEYKQPHSKE